MNQRTIKIVTGTKSGVYLTIVLHLMTICFQTSCKKFVEIPPPPGIITENTVFTTDATAISVLTEIYNSMNQSPIQGAAYPGNIGLFAGLAADEYKLFAGATNSAYVDYHHNSLNQSNPSLLSGAEHWAPLYNFVFRCNAAIEGMNASKGLTPAIKQQLLGEAKFMRAFFYFYLVNMYGEVPLALTTDPEINSQLSRSPTTEVYDLIINDLTEAEDLLSEDFLDATLLTTTDQRVRPTKWAAAALLARVYLYTSDWSNAAAQSSAVINSPFFNLPINLNDVFLKNGPEAIWQIQPTEISFNTNEARALVIPSNGPDVNQNPVQISRILKSSFESGDQRAVYGNWMDTTIYQATEILLDTVAFPFKYKIYLPDVNIDNTTGTANMTEYFMVLRLAEQYLIRAEAQAHLGNIGEAQSDLNKIRNRAGLANTTANDESSLLQAILEERRHELFSEWGHRWFDLKRTGKIDEVMSMVTPIKSNGTNQWQSYQQFYPLPYTELQRALNLRQTAGY